MLHLHPTILPNYYTNYTNTTGIGPQGAKDNDYPVAINIKPFEAEGTESTSTVVLGMRPMFSAVLLVA